MSLSKNVPVFRQHAIILEAGEWKSAFHSTQAFQLFICQALNKCVTAHEISINGYLVTEDKVYLLYQAESLVRQMALDIFLDQVHQDFNRYLLQEEESGRHIPMAESWHQLSSEQSFKAKSFNDENLKKLITGRKVDLPYKDPMLDALKQLIRTSRFSSAIDYAGGVGLVKIQRL